MNLNKQISEVRKLKRALHFETGTGLSNSKQKQPNNNKKASFYQLKQYRSAAQMVDKLFCDCNGLMAAGSGNMDEVMGFHAK